jgi:hypothetical protein
MDLGALGAMHKDHKNSTNSTLGMTMLQTDSLAGERDNREHTCLLMLGYL